MDTNVFFNLICYLLGMIGRITAPEDVCDLIPESVILHGKRHFADVIKVMALEMGDYPGSSR